MNSLPKRYLAVATAALILCCSSFVQAMTTISFWAPLGAAGRPEAMQSIIADFEAVYPDIQVEFVNVSGGFPGTFEQTLVAIAAGAGPDIVKLRLDMLPSFVRDDLALKLDRFVALEDSSFLLDFFPPLLEAVTFKDGLYGLPINSNTDLLFYNTHYFEEAGIDGPPADFQDWVMTSRLLTNIDQNRVGMALRPRDYGYTFLYANGGHFLDPETNAPRVEDPIALETLEFIMENVGTAFFPKFVPEYNASLMSGEAAMELGPPVTAQNIEQRYGEEHPFGVSVIPAGREGRTPASWGHVFVVPTSSAEQEAAWKFLTFLYRPAINAKWHVTMNFAPARISTMLQPEFSEHWVWPTFAEQLLSARPLPRVAGMFQIDGRINSAIAAAIRDRRNPAQALSELAATMRSILTENGAL